MKTLQDPSRFNFQDSRLLARDNRNVVEKKCWPMSCYTRPFQQTVPNSTVGLTNHRQTSKQERAAKSHSTRR